MGVIALALMWWLLKDSDAAVAERKRLRAEGVKFDVVGFLLVATFLGALEVVLDEGLRDDWFDSGFIITFTTIGVVAFCAMIPWCLRAKNPAVDFRLLATRQFASCFVVMLATGAILIATTQFIPQIVQEQYGYTATLAGIALAPGGVITVMAMITAGRVSSKVQPKWMIAAGGVAIAYGMYSLTWLYNDSTFWFFAVSRMFVGAGLPFVFLSVTAASYYGIRKDQTDQASALINMARNVGGSIGVCVAQNVLAHREQFHQSRLVEHADPSNPAYQATLKQATDFFATHGDPASAQSRALGWIANQVQAQAAQFAYIDVFWTLCLMAICLAPLAFILKSVPLGGARPAAH